MTIAAILSGKGSDVATVPAGTSVRDAVALLADRKIGAVPVLEDGAIRGKGSEAHAPSDTADTQGEP